MTVIMIDWGSIAIKTPVLGFIIVVIILQLLCYCFVVVVDVVVAVVGGHWVASTGSSRRCDISCILPWTRRHKGLLCN